MAAKLLAEQEEEEPPPNKDTRPPRPDDGLSLSSIFNQTSSSSNRLTGGRRTNTNTASSFGGFGGVKNFADVSGLSHPIAEAPMLATWNEEILQKYVHDNAATSGEEDEEEQTVPKNKVTAHYLARRQKFSITGNAAAVASRRVGANMPKIMPTINLNASENVLTPHSPSENKMVFDPVRPFVPVTHRQILFKNLEKERRKPLLRDNPDVVEQEMNARYSEAHRWIGRVKSFNHVISDPIHVSAPLPELSEAENQNAVKYYYQSLRAQEEVLKDQAWSKFHNAERNKQTLLDTGGDLMKQQVVHEQLFHPIHNPPNMCTVYTKTSCRAWDTLPFLPAYQAELRHSLPHKWPFPELDEDDLKHRPLWFTDSEASILFEVLASYAELWIAPKARENAARNPNMLQTRNILKSPQNPHVKSQPNSARSSSASSAAGGLDSTEQLILYRPAYARIMATIQPFFRCANYRLMIHLCDYHATPLKDTNAMQFECGLQARQWVRVFALLMRFELDSLLRCGVFEASEDSVKAVLFDKCIPALAQVAQDVYQLLLDSKAIHDRDDEKRQSVMNLMKGQGSAMSLL
ncbi:unnamed protein product, partial [Amoebophrya sp. A120]|eukprot:GSA120T00019092001.1